MTTFMHIEWIAALMGLLGTALLSFRCRWSGWGFMAYLASNAGWLTFAAEHGLVALFWQQAGFTVFSMVGVWRWLVMPDNTPPDAPPPVTSTAEQRGYNKAVADFADDAERANNFVLAMQLRRRLIK